ncbi:MAG: glutamyl-tRNA reductase [Flavipsychrobacter sp.]|nr:glutamyl-tRNA reductase [Flavipsychrobacter sp.]
MHTNNKHNIDNFWVVGINYKKSDASVRGQFAIGNEQYDRLLSLAPQYGLTDIFILSTCNRTEIYGFAANAGQLTDLICSVTAGDAATFADISYTKNGEVAMEHLYHVGAGLDSQILGDYEILGQIKKSVRHAKEHGFIGAFMERLINSVLQASKAIKTHTALSGGTVSVSFAAVQYIKEYVADIKDKKIVLVGAGKIGAITCRNLVDYLQTSNITLINRTEETAALLAKELDILSAPFAALEEELAAADIILVSTNAPEPVILKKHIDGKGRKLIIDLSVPCNVAVAAQQSSGITFVDVDMLSKIKDETLQKRKAEVPKAIAIIEVHIEELKDWYAMRKHVPVLKEVKSKLKEIQIDPMLLNESVYVLPHEAHDEKIQKVLNSLANKMRQSNTVGCNYIEAINNYIA